MSSEPEISLIQRSAARLRWAVFAAMVVIVLLYAAARFDLQLWGAHVEYRPHGGSPEAAGVIADVTSILLLVALFRLTQMLSRIAAGEMFSSGVVGSFRGFAFWLFVMALFALVAPTAAGLLRPHGGGQIEILIDFRQVLTLGVTLVLFLVARLLERARRLDEEMREFV